MANLIARFVKEDQGQDLIEYALVGGLVALGVIVAATNMGGALSGLYDKISTKLNGIVIN